MGAKEDLIAKLKNKSEATTNEALRVREQNQLFTAHLPRLYALLDAALEGVPELTISRENVSAGMDKPYLSLVIQFLGKTVRFDPCQRGQEYGVLAKNAHLLDIFFAPDVCGDWIAMPKTERPTILTGDFVVERLSELVDEEHNQSIKLWD